MNVSTVGVGHPMQPRSGRFALVICACLLLLFAAVSWFAAASKSPIYDEPYHSLSSWLQLRYADFRYDNEDPPLWQYWASLPNSRSALTVDFDDPLWKAMPQQLVHQWYWGVQVMFRTSGNDPIRLINRCRAMMLCLAILLGVLISYWSWKIGGPIAAVAATTLFCFDPNFLAHASLMKNDVAFAMSMFGLAMALWRAGKKLDVEAVGWVLLMCVVTLGMKFSGIVAVMLVPLLLGIRALLPLPWPVFGRAVSTRRGRLSAAVGVTVMAAVIGFAGIWAMYGFRFSPTPEKGVWLNMIELTEKIRRNEFLARYGGSPPAGLKSAEPLPIGARAALFADDHHLLPQPFLAGLLFTYSNALIRSEYLCGQLSVVGWWWYFPFVILVKTPLATLLAGGLGGLILLGRLRRGMLRNLDLCWTALCLLVPFAMFLSSAMASSLNIGIRHILSIYPFAYVAVGCVAASLWRTRGAKTRIAVLGLGVVLAIESLSVFPSFIPFFNYASASTPGGKLGLLGDSNLDWGQDLPLLVQWQQDHPTEKLCLSYFGYVDPQYYGLKYLSLPGGYTYDAHRQWVDPYSPSVVAISATNLQGILMDDPVLLAYYARWRKQKPFAILGDSIYLYRNQPGGQ
jgi:hypothetical protein